jgi:CBS domain containing-hemolysin-like protein
VPLHRALHVARLSLLVLGAVAAADALAWWQRPWAAALAAWGVAVALVFVVGDALPRSVARIAPELMAGALPLARRTLAPFGLLLRLLGWVETELHAWAGTERPLEPNLGVAQRDMLLGVFTLADTSVDEVMTPRLDMVAVDLTAATSEVVEALRQSGHSRLPVFDGTVDNIVGIVFAKDLIPLALGVGESAVVGRWQDLVRPAAYVPETKTLDSQLRDFHRGPAHLAIVVDDLSQALGRSFEHAEVSTVGGLIYSVLGRVPRAGDELTLDGYRVVVERVDRRRVTRVLFQRQP